ncbi:unnamed protein product, partial [marine sediment metagenome]
MAITLAKFEAYNSIKDYKSLYETKDKKLIDDSIIRIALEEYDVNLTKKDIEEMKKNWEGYWQKGNTPESYFYIKQGEKANPSSFVTKKYLNSQEHKPGMRANLFKRLHKNLWVSGEESFISDEDFRACIDYKLKRRPEGKIPIWLGLDVGISNDYTAICGV